MSLRRKLFLLTLTTLLGLLFLEGGARALWSAPELVLNPVHVILQDDPTLFWTLRPHLDTTLREEERLRVVSRGSVAPNQTHLRTNRLGLRNEEVTQPKPGDVFRILSLGESTTMGDWVNLEETYSKVLERGLNALPSQGKRFEVINAGVGAWSVWQSSIYLQERGMALQPDLVLSYHATNDKLPRGVVDPHNYMVAVSGTDRELYERRRKVAPYLRALSSSRLYLALRKLILWGVVRTFHDTPRLRLRAQGPRVPEEDRVLAMDRIRETCRVGNAKWMILQPVYATPYADALLEKYAQEHGVAYLNLQLLRYQQRWPHPNDLFADSIHPSAAGHARIGLAIRDALWRSGLVPVGGTPPPEPPPVSVPAGAPPLEAQSGGPQGPPLSGSVSPGRGPETRPNGPPPHGQPGPPPHGQPGPPPPGLPGPVPLPPTAPNSPGH